MKHLSATGVWHSTKPTPEEPAMTYENDPNQLDNRSRVPMRAGMGWGIPLAIAAVVLIAGLLFFNPSGDRTTTASNTPHDHDADKSEQPGTNRAGSGAEQTPTPRRRRSHPTRSSNQGENPASAGFFVRTRKSSAPAMRAIGMEPTWLSAVLFLIKAGGNHDRRSLEARPARSQPHQHGRRA